MSDEKPKTGKYRLGSAFLWAAGQGAVARLAIGESFWRTIGAGFGGLVAGWATASLLGRFARWGLGYRMMMILGVIVGVAISSGAVAGLGALIDLYKLHQLKFDWEGLGKFVVSSAAIPAAVLGLLTGIYVRSRIPRPPPA